MKVIFVSNFFNHHQKPLADEMYLQSEGRYRFIATETIPDERVKLGWGMDSFPAYVIPSTYTNSHMAEILQLINESDVVIIGSASDSFIRERLRLGKLTFRYFERPFRNGWELYKYPVRFYRWHKNNPQSNHFYVLCASAYTSSDFAKFFLFKNKCYKWGYFPEVKSHNIAELINAKEANSILWVGRLLDWKHPEVPILIAEKLKQKGYVFKLNIIGCGSNWEKIARMIDEKQLNAHVHLHDAMPPEQIRKYMERAKIYLFTSDRREGWGAVLNEAMNSGCGVVASHAIGSVPFLIDNGVNGYIYQDGNIDNICQKVEYLLAHPAICAKLGQNAYSTMESEWNAKNATQRFFVLCNKLLDGEVSPFPYAHGVCSRAESLNDNWFNKIKNRIITTNPKACKTKESNKE